MTDERLLEEIIALCEAGAIRVRREPLEGSSGGLCRVLGKLVLFVDSGSKPAEAASVCARALVQVLDPETVYMPPEVRRFIEQHTAEQNGSV